MAHQESLTPRLLLPQLQAAASYCDIQQVCNKGDESDTFWKLDFDMLLFEMMNPEFTQNSKAKKALLSVILNANEHEFKHGSTAFILRNIKWHIVWKCSSPGICWKPCALFSCCITKSIQQDWSTCSMVAHILIYWLKILPVWPAYRLSFHAGKHGNEATSASLLTVEEN